MIQFGGQTSIKLTDQLNKAGVKILGTAPEYIDAAEDRKKFDKILEEIGVPRPKGNRIYPEEALRHQ